MARFRQATLCLALALLGAASAASPAASARAVEGNEADKSAPVVTTAQTDPLQQFTIGTDTLTSVQQRLGKPSSSVRLADGTTIAVYLKNRTRVKGASFIPLVGLFAGGAKSSVSTVTFTFGPDGILSDMTSSEANANCSTTFGGVRCQ